MHVFGRDVLQVGVVNLCADFDVVRHARRCGYVVEFPIGMRGEFVGVAGFAGELRDAGASSALVVDEFYFLDDFKQSRPARYAVCFERWSYGKADCLVGARGVGYYEVGFQWVKSERHTFCRCVERFEVDGYVCALAVHDDIMLF